MPKGNVLKTNFTGGEVSPLVQGRSDTGKYVNGAATIENFIVRPQGGAHRRPGTKYVGSARNHSVACIIQEFEFSDLQSYILEIGGSRALEISNVSDNGSGLVRVTISNHGYSTGSPVVVTGVTGATGANGHWKVTRISKDAFVLQNSTFGGTYTPGTGTATPGVKVAPITGAVDNGSGLIRITLNGHGFTTGDTIGIADVGGVANANGSWTVTVITANTFDLDGSTMSGTYTSGGIAIDDGGDSGYIRIWGSDALVYGGVKNMVAGIGNSGGLIQITTDVNHLLTTGDAIVVDAVGGTVPCNGAWVVTVTGAQTFTLDGSAYSGTWSTSDGGFVSADPTVISVPYSASDLPNLKFTQSADVMWVVHPDYPPRTLKRASAYNWSCEEYETENGPYVAGVSSRLSANIIGAVDYVGIIELELSEQVFTDATLQVTVKGVQGLTEANGTWNVDVTGNSIRLIGSTYSDTYSGGGVAEADVEIQVTNIADTADLQSDVEFNRQTVNRGASTTPNGFDDPADIGRYLEFYYDDKFVYAKITAITDTKNATIDIEDNVIETSSQDDFHKARVSGKSYSTGNGSPVTPTEWPVYNQLSTSNQRGIISFTQSNVLTSSDIGKYVRVYTNNGSDPIPPGQADYAWVRVIGRFYDILNRYHVLFSNYNFTGVELTNPHNVIGYDAYQTPINWTLKNRKKTATCTARGRVFKVTDVGRKIRIGFAGTYIDGKIISVTDTPPTVNSCTIEYQGVIPIQTINSSLPINNGFTKDYRLGAWSQRTGYPSDVCFHEQRLIFTSTYAEPQTMWMSVSADFANFLPTERDGTVLDDSAITYAFASRKVNKITWIQSGPVLLVGTIGGEWQIRAASSIAEPITPSNIAVTPQTSIGSITGDSGQKVGPGVLFIDRAGDKLWDLTYSFDLDAWKASDTTIVSEHIFRDYGGALETAYQQQPHGLIWVRCASGDLACLTFDRGQEVAAWHRHEIDGGTASVDSIAVINTGNGESQSVYLLVSRSIGTIGNRRHIVKITPDVYSNTLYSHKLLDHHTEGIVAGGSLTGLDYLNGSSVMWRSEDGTTGTGTVTGGALALGAYYNGSSVIAGFPYDSILKLLPADGGSGSGTAVGKTKRINKLSALFYQSCKAKIYDANTSYTSDAIRIDRFASSDNVFSGYREIEIMGDYGLAGQPQFVSSGDTPLTVLAVYPQQWVRE